MNKYCDHNIYFVLGVYSNIVTELISDNNDSCENLIMINNINNDLKINQTVLTALLMKVSVTFYWTVDEICSERNVIQKSK